MSGERGALQRIAEAGIFAALALALHAAILWSYAETGIAAERGGDGGEAALTMQAADAGTAALVAEWDARPSVAESAPALAPPPPSASQTAAPPEAEAEALPPPLPDGLAPATLPPSTLPPPATVAEASVDTEDSAEIAPETAPQPRERPERVVAKKPAPKAPSPPRKTAPQKPAPENPAQHRRPSAPNTAPAAAGKGSASEDQAASKAAGSTGSGMARDQGEGGAKAAPVDKGAERDALRDWGRSIYIAVERKKAAPRSARGGGVVTLVLTVTQSGGLADVTVRKGSGSDRLDRAAMEAARQAAPFKPAPDTLTQGSYQFSLNMKFQR